MSHYRLDGVWRSRATIILGAVVLLFALFSGFPSWFNTVVYVLVSLAIILLGVAGSRPDEARETSPIRPPGEQGQ